VLSLAADEGAVVTPACDDDEDDDVVEEEDVIVNFNNTLTIEVFVVGGAPKIVAGPLRNEWSMNESGDYLMQVT
jgi:hypothetical protein